MSEETLRQVLERLHEDKEFRRALQHDWEAALGDLDLSPAELIALAARDEDSLRRLAATDVASQGLGFWGTDFICSLACTIVYKTAPVDTPGSGRDTCPGGKGQCGTGGGETWCRLNC